jgi:DNA repair photolyase
MLKEFSKTRASTGLHFMPIIPYLTDIRENVDRLYAHAKESEVDYVLPGVLYLRGKTKKVFLNFISSEFPELLAPLQLLYKTGGVGREYKDTLYPMVNEIKAKYGLSSSYSKLMKEKSQQKDFQQMTLFAE